VPSEENIKNYTQTAISKQNSGTELPFSVVYKSTEKIIGYTCCYIIDQQNKRLEIGYT